MIFKVLFQEPSYEVPVRERTKSSFIEADSIRDVRKKVIDRNVNIEYIQKLDDAHLAYEKKSADFRVEEFR